MKSMLLKFLIVVWVGGLYAAEADEQARRLLFMYEKVIGSAKDRAAINAVKMTGTLQEGKESRNITWYWQKPNQVRVELRHELLGKQYLEISVYDGNTCWGQTLLPKEEKPFLLPADACSDLRKQSDFFGPLIDWESSDNTYIYQGKEILSKRDVYVLQVEFPNDRPAETYYFDAQKFVPILVENTGKIASAEVTLQTFPKRMQREGKVMINMSQEQAVSLQVFRELTFHDIQINPELPEDFFAMPQRREIWLRGKP